MCQQVGVPVERPYRRADSLAHGCRDPTGPRVAMFRATPHCAPPLIGREAEFAQLWVGINAARSGQTTVVALAGEPGIGKSRLLAALAERAEEIGALILRGGAVEVKVTVMSAPWVVVDRVELRLARGVAPAAIALTPASRSGALVAQASFAVRVREDDALLVLVSGTKPMRPVLSGDDAEIAPFAMSGPIWIDADGDGRALGRAGTPIKPSAGPPR